MEVTVGIPAYNEERNIRSLLKAILEQESVKISKIILVDDGSNDTTVAEARALKDEKIMIIENPNRLGKNNALNTIFYSSSTDFLIVFDADIKLNNTNLFINILEEAKALDCDLVSLKVNPVGDINLVSKIVSYGQKIKNYYYENAKCPDNVHTCVGRGLVLSKNLYKSIKLPTEIIGDDAYIWFFAKENNYKYKYFSTYFIEYTSPSLVADHLKQNGRYRNSKKQLESYFNRNKVKIAYNIDLGDKLKINLYGAKNNMLLYVGYLFLYVFAFVKSLTSKETSGELWSPAISTK